MCSVLSRVDSQAKPTPIKYGSVEVEGFEDIDISHGRRLSLEP